MSRLSPTTRAVARFFCLLALVVWLGGLAFVAIGAPAMFHVPRELGPQMVGAALGAFTRVTYVCAVLALAGWLVDRSSKPSLSQTLWRAQGVCLAAMLALAFYAGRTIMPEMQNLQPSVVASAAANRADDTRSRFDSLHKRYRSVTSSVVLFGLVALGCFAARSVSEERDG